MFPTSQAVAREFRGGWLRKRSSEEAVDDVGHCILLVLHRCRDREEFLMGVVNTGTVWVSCCPIATAGRTWNHPMPQPPSKLLRSERDCWILSFRVWDGLLDCAVFEQRTKRWGFLWLILLYDTTGTMDLFWTGEGLQYHPASLSRVPPNPEMPLRQSPLVLTGVNLDRARSSGFWYLLFRQIVYPDPANGTFAKLA